MRVNGAPEREEDRLNLVEMVRWAEANPATVASIVESSRAFSALHLSELGQTCYMARLLQAYAALLVLDAERPAMAPLPPGGLQRKGHALGALFRAIRGA